MRDSVCDRGRKLLCVVIVLLVVPRPKEKKKVLYKYIIVVVVVDSAFMLHYLNHFQTKLKTQNKTCPSEQM